MLHRGLKMIRGFAARLVAPLLLLLPLASPTRAASQNLCSLEQLETDPGSAIAPCTAVIADPGSDAADRAMAHYIRGRAFIRTARRDAAMKDYDAALKLDPNNADIYVSRGWAAITDGDRAKAFSDAETAAQLDPNNARAIDIFGFMKMQRRDIDGALQAYSQAIAIDPEMALAWLHRMQLNQGLGKLREALADADGLVALDPTKADRECLVGPDGHCLDFHAEGLIDRAGIYAKLGDKDHARDDYTAAVTAAPIERTFLSRGDFFVWTDDRMADGLKDAEAAIAIAPLDPPAHSLRSSALDGLHRYDEALSEATFALWLAPRDARLYAWRADVYRTLGRIDDAVSDYETAINLDPSRLMRSLPMLAQRGYWLSKEPPKSMTIEVQDAIRACAIDNHCAI